MVLQSEARGKYWDTIERQQRVISKLQASLTSRASAKPGEVPFVQKEYKERIGFLEAKIKRMEAQMHKQELALKLIKH